MEQTKKYKLVIFDIDGTLVTTKSGETFRKSADDWQWLPGRVERCQRLVRDGYRIAFASNQAGVAFPWSKFTEQDIEDEVAIMADAVDADTWRCCYSSPNPKALPQYFNANDPNRKPGSGMLLDIMDHLEESAKDTLFVGDRPEDKQAAAAAGVSFQWAEDFFDGAH